MKQAPKLSIDVNNLVTELTAGLAPDEKLYVMIHKELPDDECYVDMAYGCGTECDFEEAMTCFAESSAVVLDPYVTEIDDDDEDQPQLPFDPMPTRTVQ